MIKVRYAKAFILLLLYRISSINSNAETKNFRKDELLNARYCLKAIEHLMLIHNNFQDNNTSRNTEKIGYNFSYKNYFNGENIQTRINTYSTIMDLFYAYEKILDKNEVYSANKEFFKFKNDDNDGDVIAKIWFKFIIAAKYIYENINKVLEKEINESKNKKSIDGKQYAACKYFKDTYDAKIKEYKMFVDHFDDVYNNKCKNGNAGENFNELKKYILSHQKNVFTKLYKDKLFIEYRRKKTNGENDNGFDQFPCYLFV